MINQCIILSIGVKTFLSLTNPQEVNRLIFIGLVNFVGISFLPGLYKSSVGWHYGMNTPKVSQVNENREVNILEKISISCPILSPLFCVACLLFSKHGEVPF